MKVEHFIQSEADLETVIGAPRASTSKKVTTKLDPFCEAFIKLSPMVFVATTDKSLKQDVSPKGDAPGFVHAYDEHTLLVPERPGNRLAYGFRNILETGKIGLVFVVPGVTETLRINGSAKLSKDPELLEQLSAKGKPALLCTIVTIEECFMHCGKSMIRSKLWDPQSWDTDHGFSFAKQIAHVTKEDEGEIEEVVADAYVNKLY